MAIEIVEGPLPNARPVHLVTRGKLAEAGLPAAALAWAEAAGFDGEAGRLLLLPDGRGKLDGAVFGMPSEQGGFASLATGSLARLLPEGEWRFARGPARPDHATLGLILGGYEYSAYRKKSEKLVRFQMPGGVDFDWIKRTADGVCLARDLINTPANDLGPEAMEAAARRFAKIHKARISVIRGDDLLKRNFPMIHAVGRAAAEEPRLVDITWGNRKAPLVTIVGKGVCFDTGGLDIKPASGMLLMKKDMGGAANALGLASMLIAAAVPIRLRVLLPIVENAISASAFRPGDVLVSRKGLTVEIGNTDAEGRLILADALALADEEKPDLVVDLATLTGAARVALGPDLPPFYTDDEPLAAELATAAEESADPLWRLPLWSPYDAKLASKIADLNNVTPDGMAGSVTAALFLRRFVKQAKAWVHLDVFGWNPAERPHAPVGGEAQGIRALAAVIERRYGTGK